MSEENDEVLEEVLESEEEEETTIDRGDDPDSEEEDTLEEDSEEEEVTLEEDSEEEEKKILEKDIKVPKARLDEVISQREEQKERVQWLEDQLSVLIDKGNTPKEIKKKEDQPEYDFSKSEAEYANLLIEGDTVKASSLRNEIDEERRLQTLSLIESVKESSIKEAATKTEKAIDDDKFDSLILNYENKYGFLDAESEEYNEEAVETINTLLAGYVASGKTRSQSLTMAVKKAIPLYKVSEKSSKATLGNKRKKAALTKSAKASRSQPPESKTKKTDNRDAEEIDISKLSEKDFKDLTAKEKSILRGD